VVITTGVVVPEMDRRRCGRPAAAPATDIEVVRRFAMTL
jgi:hypothetical protein